MFYIKDDNGVKSQTTTLVWVGVGTGCLKLLLASAEIKGMKFGEFAGSDFALVVSPFLALLAHKRQVGSKQPAKMASLANLSNEQKGD